MHFNYKRCCLFFKVHYCAIDFIENVFVNGPFNGTRTRRFARLQTIVPAPQIMLDTFFEQP